MAGLMNGGEEETREMPSLVKDGHLSADTVEEKANLLAESFASLSSDENYNAAFKQRRQECEADPDFAIDNSSDEERNKNDLNKPLTLNELREALKQSKNKRGWPGSSTTELSTALKNKSSTRLEQWWRGLSTGGR